VPINACSPEAVAHFVHVLHYKGPMHANDDDDDDDDEGKSRMG
jgi:hypothetical protein